MAKAFATYEQQIEKLGGNGLLVEDAAYAEQQLRDIGYFALVNGYKRLLRDPSTGRYGAGASFSDLVALYEFDSSLRELFSHSLTYVERKMRRAVSYSFCDKHGEAQSAYLDPANYSGSRKHAGGIAKLVRMLGGPPPADRSPTPGRAALEAVGRPLQCFLWAAGSRHARQQTAKSPEAPSRSNEMRFRPADIRVPNVRRADTPSSGAATG